MRITRSHIRNGAIYLAGAVVTVAILAPVGQFFISLADEWGWYQHPSAKVAAVLMWLATLTGHAWFHWSGGAIVGFAVGVWLDALMKRRDDTEIPAPTNEKKEPDVSRPLLGDLSMDKPDSTYVHLCQVCAMIFGNLGKCNLRDTIEGTSPDEDDILNTVATIVAKCTDIYGVRHSSNVLAKVDQDELQHLKMFSGALCLVEPQRRRTIYGRLCVKRDEINGISAAIMNTKESLALHIR
jgi:hypothetical protein